MANFSHHHAFLIPGDKSQAESFYNELLQDKNIEVSFIFEKNLSIDTARQIKDIASQTTYKSLRYIIVSAYSLGNETQNALLKTLEELSESKKIIFFVESLDSLLPTFISRFSKEGLDIEKKEKVSNKTKDFSVKSLLKEVEKIGKDIKDEKSTKSQAAAFLDEIIIHQKADIEKVKKLLYFKTCLAKPSASVKQILESAVAIAL